VTAATTVAEKLNEFAVALDRNSPSKTRAMPILFTSINGFNAQVRQHSLPGFMRK
jgi:hypothetical protein